MLNAQLGVANLHNFKVHNNHLMNYDEKCSDLIQARCSSFVTLAEGSDEEDVEIVSYSNILFSGISLIVFNFQDNVCNVYL